LPTIRAVCKELLCTPSLIQELLSGPPANDRKGFHGESPPMNKSESTSPAWNPVVPGFIAVLLLGVVLRLAWLGEQPLWIDEAYSVWYASRDWGYLWQIVPQIDPHPMLYYSLLKLWMVLGDSETILRLASALVSILTLPLIFLLGRWTGGETRGDRVGLLGMLVFAVSSVQINFAQEARPYAFWIFAMAAALAALAWLVSNPAEAVRPWRDWRRHPAAAGAYAALALSLSLLIWFHNTGFFYIAGIGLFCLGWWAISLRCNRYAFLNLFAAAALALLLYVPNIPTLLMQAANADNTFWIKAPDAMKFTKTTVAALGIWVPRLLRWRWNFALDGVLGLLACAGLLALWLRGRSVFAVMLVFTSLVPLALVMAVTFLAQPVFMYRIILPMFVPLAVMMAASLLWFSGRVSSSLVAAVLAGIYALLLPNYYMDPDRKEPWDRIAATLMQDPGGGTVIVSPNSAALPLGYYLKRAGSDIELISLPKNYPAMEANFSHPGGGNGVAGIDWQAVEILRTVTGKGDPDWVVLRSHKMWDPDDLVKPWLQQRYCLTRHEFPPRNYLEVYRLTPLAAGSAAPCASPESAASVRDFDSGAVLGTDP
jgi:mannosyltransferase